MGVLNKNVESAKGCRLFSTLFPCAECAKVVIQSGIRTVIYASDKNGNQTTFKAARRLFAMAGVNMIHHVPDIPEIRVSMSYPGDAPPAKKARTEVLERGGA